MTSSTTAPLPPDQPGLSPWKLIQTYSADEWETFIAEWAEAFDPPYTQVVPLGRAGDKGRDVIGYIGDPTDPKSLWDSYQCKRYENALRPTEIYVELAKLCVYTHRGDYTVPRRYRFVAPRGIGTKLHDLLKKPEELRKELIANWDHHCKKKVSEAEEFPLTGALRNYVDAFDFRIVWFLTPQEVLAQHQRTRYWHRRFKIDPPTRPPNKPIPDAVQPHELPYTTKLLHAYADRTHYPITSVQQLATNVPLFEHFRRSRGYFYSAEALARFSRDHFSIDAFTMVKQHIYDVVLDVALESHADGYSRVLKVTQIAASLPLPHNDIVPYVGPADKKGICHHLANEDAMTWVSS